MDPCFGGGVFLRSACKRLIELRGNPKSQVFGVEIDPEVHQRITDKLDDEFSLPRENLTLADFFVVEATQPKLVDAIIGNPPFVRYQRFSGDSRKLALARCFAHGVRLPELCSSWAPFLIHCIAMLRSGGRLAMVLPMEIAHAKYARPVLDYIRRSFRTVTFLTFREKLFPDLSEGTVLLIAEDKGGAPSEFLLRDFAHSGLLAGVCERDQSSVAGTRRLNAETIASAESRLIEYLIPEKARALYRELEASERAQRLGHLADVGIGYVTGANNFFHLDVEEARHRAIPDEFLKRAVRRGRALSGLRIGRPLRAAERPDSCFIFKRTDVYRRVLKSI
jgi:adenine-specific DNA-methyltransferase